MAQYDLPLEALEVYYPPRQEPSDFDAFWNQTLEQARVFPLGASFEEVDFGLKGAQTYDVTFNGYNGQAIKGWLLIPRYYEGLLPCIVEYIGYGGGRGFPVDWLAWSAAGYANLIMDTRGQGSAWLKGDTPDAEPEGSSPQYPGFMTRGILNPETYYYRRLITDAVRAVETARSHPLIDANRVAVTGHSQGGGLSIIVGGLLPDIPVVMPGEPFLCAYKRATELIDTHPYVEISNFCKVHRDQIDRVFETLSYFDGVNFAVRAKGRALFSVGLMDDICPPSTVFAAYNYYVGPKEINVYAYNEHEGGRSHQLLAQMDFLKRAW